MLMSPAPVMCKPPPFPGAAIAGATPALLLLRITFTNIIPNPAPELSSIPPPALLAVLDDISESFTIRILPTSLKIPPPEPEAPFAMLFEMMEVLMVIVVFVE